MDIEINNQGAAVVEPKNKKPKNKKQDFKK